MDRYPAISEHGLIGDLQTAALVSTDGTIDWFCCPRFDSPSIFASLLDHDRGGHFRIGPDRDDYVSRQLYFPDTAILITRFMTPDGVGEIVDFMPVVEGEATDRHRLVRLLRVVRGTMRFRMDIQPRFDYGRKPHELQLTDDGALFVSDDLTLTLHRADVPGRSLREQGTSLERDVDGLRITKTGREGGVAGVVMESAGGPPRSVHPQELVELFNDTVRFWRGWLQPLDVQRPLAGAGNPLGDDAQANDLCSDRWAGCRPDGRPTRTGGRRAQLGLPLHLDPRRLILRVRVARAWLHR